MKENLRLSKISKATGNAHYFGIVYNFTPKVLNVGDNASLWAFETFRGAVEDPDKNRRR